MELKDSILEIPTLTQSVKNLLDAFKQKFFVTQKFIDAKLKDGTIIRYEGDMPQPGMPVQVITQDGQLMPAPDGELYLEDGSVIVTKDGVIMEIKPANAEQAPAAPEEMETAPVTPSQVQDQQSAKRIIESIVKESVFVSVQDFNDLKESFSKAQEVTTALAEENKNLKEQLEKTNEFSKELFSLVEKMADIPTATSSVKKKDEFKRTEVNPLDRMQTLLDSAKELSNKTFKN